MRIGTRCCPAEVRARAAWGEGSSAVRAYALQDASHKPEPPGGPAAISVSMGLRAGPLCGATSPAVFETVLDTRPRLGLNTRWSCLGLQGAGMLGPSRPGTTFTGSRSGPESTSGAACAHSRLVGP